ncbi:olfactory receptor 2G6-like [Carettochelys insculpta]|uniref:olfactory receptor 2G6-like n=1 Tax=Carettochelys insculpta TaxID=44489 RepID=UPI003EC0F81B
MEKIKGRNQTPIAEFIILGFGNGPELQPLVFLLFLLIYIATVAGNSLTIVLVIADHHLHTPMYYFLGHLSFLEVCYTSAFLPPLLASLLSRDRTISAKVCVGQLVIYGGLSTTETVMLSAMSYDRYLAICRPLRYAALMNGQLCCQIAGGCWISSFLLCAIANSFFWQLTFCGSKEIDHFFCDYSSMIKLSCDDTSTVEMVTAVVAVIGVFVPFLLTLTSYIFIIAAILRIPSATGRQKAFSTCSSHLIVLVIFYVTVITVFMVPAANTPKVLHKIFSVFYIVLTPLLNPVIYCLRNKEVKGALRSVVLQLAASRNHWS